MKKEEQKLPENTVQETTETAIVSQTPEEDAWMAGMESKYPDLKGNREAMFKASREGYDKEHELNKENASAYKAIDDAIGSSPEVAMFMNRIVNKTDENAEPEEAFAEFGEDLVDLLTGKTDNETYRTKKKERADKMAEDEKMRAEKEAAEKEITTKAGEAFVAACEELGMSPEDAEKKLMDKYGNSETSDFRLSQDFYKALLKSLTYEDDMLAAEARGRNAQMGERDQRRMGGTDGLPHGNNGGGMPKKYDPNSLAAMAEQRRRMSN